MIADLEEIHQVNVRNEFPSEAPKAILSSTDAYEESVPTATLYISVHLTLFTSLNFDSRWSNFRRDLMRNTQNKPGSK